MDLIKPAPRTRVEAAHDLIDEAPQMVGYVPAEIIGLLRDLAQLSDPACELIVARLRYICRP